MSYANEATFLNHNYPQYRYPAAQDTPAASTGSPSQSTLKRERKEKVAQVARQAVPATLTDTLVSVGETPHERSIALLAVKDVFCTEDDESEQLRFYNTFKKEALKANWKQTAVTASERAIEIQYAARESQVKSYLELYDLSLDSYLSGDIQNALTYCLEAFESSPLEETNWRILVKTLQKFSNNEIFFRQVDQSFSKMNANPIGQTITKVIPKNYHDALKMFQIKIKTILGSRMEIDGLLKTLTVQTPNELIIITTKCLMLNSSLLHAFDYILTYRTHPSRNREAFWMQITSLAETIHQIRPLLIPVNFIRSLYQEGIAGLSSDNQHKIYPLFALFEARFGDVNKVNTLLDEAVILLKNRNWEAEVIRAVFHAYLGKRDISLLKSFEEANKKDKINILLLWITLCELRGDFLEARKLFEKYMTPGSNFSKDWRVTLSLINFEIRSGNKEEARRLAVDAVLSFSNYGRLQQRNLQLNYSTLHDDKHLEQIEAILVHLPKSGEVLLEGARLCMNPLSIHFNLISARNYISRALFHTDQYGDIVIELLKLEYLEKKFNPSVDSPPFNEKDWLKNESWIERFAFWNPSSYGDLDTDFNVLSSTTFQEILFLARERIHQMVTKYESLYKTAILSPPNSLKVTADDTKTYLNLMSAFGNTMEMMQKQTSQTFPLFDLFWNRFMNQSIVWRKLFYS